MRAERVVSDARPDSASRDLLLTAATSLAYIVGNVVLVSMLAERGAVEVFAPYSFARRVATGLMPILCLGMNVGLVRRMAERDPGDKGRVAAAGIIVFGSTAVLALTSAVVGLRLLAPVLDPFGGTAMYWATVWWALAVAANSFVYAMFRGSFMQRRANIVTLVSMTVLPLAVLLFAPAGTGASFLMGSTALLVTVWIAASAPWTRIFVGLRALAGAGVVGEVRSLLGFSASRIPAASAVAMLMVVGPWAATRSGDARAAGYLLAGFAFAQVVNAAVGSVGIVLLPRVAAMSADPDRGALKSVVERSLFVSLGFAATVTPALVVASGPLVGWWLGAEFVAGVRVVTVVLLATPAVVLYTLLASIIDGYRETPFTTFASLIALALCTVMSLLVADDPVSLAWVFTGCQSLAAAILFGVLVRDLRPRAFLVRHLAAAGLVLALAWLSLRLAQGAADLVSVLIAGACAGAGAVATLWFSPGELGLRERLTSALGARDA